MDGITSELKTSGFKNLGAYIITKRFYDVVPTVDWDNPLTDANGALPYNAQCVEPWIAAEMPGHAGQIDAYSWIEDTRWLVTTSDGIHLWAGWERVFAEWIL